MAALIAHISGGGAFKLNPHNLPRNLIARAGELKLKINAVVIFRQLPQYPFRRNKEPEHAFSYTVSHVGVMPLRVRIIVHNHTL